MAFQRLSLRVAKEDRHRAYALGSARSTVNPRKEPMGIHGRLQSKEFFQNLLHTFGLRECSLNGRESSSRRPLVTFFP